MSLRSTREPLRTEFSTPNQMQPVWRWAVLVSRVAMLYAVSLLFILGCLLVSCVLEDNNNNVFDGEEEPTEEKRRQSCTSCSSGRIHPHTRTKQRGAKKLQQTA